MKRFTLKLMFALLFVFSGNALAIRVGGAIGSAYPSVVRIQGYYIINAMGDVAINECTGTAFKLAGVGNSYAILTAKSCVPSVYFENPSLTYYVYDINGSQIPVTEMYIYANYWAVLRVDRPIPYSSPLLTYTPPLSSQLLLLGNGEISDTTNPRSLRFGVSYVNEVIPSSWQKFLKSNHGPSANALCYGDIGGPAMVGGKIAAIAYSNSSSNYRCSGVNASYFLDVQAEKEWMGWVADVFNSPNACRHGRSIYYSTTGTRAAFVSDGGCRDLRYGYRYYRYLNGGTWSQHQSACSNIGYALTTSGLIKQARRFNTTGSHLAGDPNQLMWTSDNYDANRAYAIRLGSGERELHWKSESLGGTCYVGGLQAFPPR